MNLGKVISKGVSVKAKGIYPLRNLSQETMASKGQRNIFSCYV